MLLFFALLSLISFSAAHVTVVGSIGPGPNDPAFFKADSFSPCPAPISDTQRVNVSAGTVFNVQWALWANHNNPPALNGFVHFNWFVGVPTTKSQGIEIVPKLVVSTQPTNYYWTQDVIVIPGDALGRGTLQIVYDVNGQNSPFPLYYQCINFFVSMATKFEAATNTVRNYHHSSH